MEAFSGRRFTDAVGDSGSERVNIAAVDFCRVIRLFEDSGGVRGHCSAPCVKD